MATINHKTYNEATETFKDFSVYDGKETLIFKVDGADQTVYASNIIGSGIIKTSDNGPLSATAKYLSDGLGNNSALALSTSLVGVGATTLFTKMSIANSLSATSIGTNYNAGILNIQNTNTTNGNLSLIGFQDASASINLAAVGAINTVHSASPNSVVGELGFYTKASGGGYVTERMRISSTGNVGIGTSAPAQKLHVSSSETTAYAASSASLIQPDGGSNLLIQNTGESGFASLRFAALNASNAVGYFGFNNNTANVGGSFIFGQRTGESSYAEQMRITDTGNVGIGTSSPAYKLQINASGGNGLSLLGDVDNESSVLFGDSGSAAIGRLTYSNIDDSMRIFTNGTEKVRITSAGNVGIGTSSPTQKLTVNGNAAVGGQQAFWLRDDDGFTANGGRRAWAITANYNAFGTFSIYGASALDSDPLAGTAFLNITSAGNVGIGTTSPASILAVSAASPTITLTATTTTATTIGNKNNRLLLLADSTTVGNGGEVVFGTGDTSTGRWAAISGNITTNSGTGSAGSIIFATKAADVDTSLTERLRITSAGNVGIGTSTPVSALQVSGGGLFTSGTHSDASLVTGMKIGFDTTLGYGYLESVQVDATAKPLRINQFGGLVGVGNITPAVQLDVAGNIRSSTGILFGSDTAAANTLDDYEEGTWTMGVAFGGASVGVTTSSNTGTYTKIGRQVTVTGYLVLTSKGSSTGNANITGLPFTVGATGGYYSATSLWFNNVSFADAYQGYGVIADTIINLQETTNAGSLTAITDANFANNSEMVVSLTYFV